MEIDFRKKVILSYIQKHQNIDYYILSDYLNSPMTLLVRLLKELVDDGIVRVSDGIMILTKSKSEIDLLHWDEISWTIECSEEKAQISHSFVWDELYIPIDFRK